MNEGTGSGIVVVTEGAGNKGSASLGLASAMNAGTGSDFFGVRASVKLPPEPLLSAGLCKTQSYFTNSILFR